MNQEELIAELRQQKNSAFRLLYASYYPLIEKHVLRNTGTRDEAQDVFQETLVVLLEKVPADNFSFTSSVRTYVMAVAKNIWLKKLREKKNLLPISEGTGFEDLSFAAWEEKENQQHAKHLLQRIFSRVSRHCYRLLALTFFKGASRDELVHELGYKNNHTFDNQKYKCLEQARKIN